MHELSHDLVTALRNTARRPAFTALVVAILALGIGCNAAVYTVVEAVLLRPLPWSEPERLAMVWNGPAGGGEEPIGFSVRELRALVGSNPAAAAIGGYEYRGETLRSDDRSRLLWSAGLTRELLPLLGAEAAMGRAFVPEDFEGDGAPVALISESLWREELGSSPSIVGTTIRVDGTALEVVGVMPSAFVLPTDYRWSGQTELYRPLPLRGPAAEESEGRTIWAVARLAPGIGGDEARAALDAGLAELRRSRPDDYPGTAPWSVRLVPIEREVLGNVRPALLALIGAVGLVLLIACANVANLLLVRADHRRREMALRTALGAGRWRLLRLLLVESFVLALAGGALGLLLARWGVAAAIAVAPQELPRLSDAELGGSGLAVGLGLSAVASLLFGLLPAWRASRENLDATLRSGGRALVGGGFRDHGRRALVAAEVALAVALLIGAGLLIRSLGELGRVDLGYEPDGLVTGDVLPPPDRYPGETELLALQERVLRAVEAVPGVRSAAMTSSVPFWNPASLAWVDQAEVRGLPETAETPIAVAVEAATPEVFDTLGVEILDGRGFEEGDREDAPPVAVVSRSFIQRLSAQQGFVGRRIHLAGWTGGAWAEVVGIAEDVRDVAVEHAPSPRVYLPRRQLGSLLDTPPRYMSVMARIDGSPDRAISGLRAAVAEIDPELPLANATTVKSYVDESLARFRFSAVLLTVFAGLAVGLAVFGIYGVLSYSVARRTDEIGIRMVLGAEVSRVVGMVTAQGLLLTVLGLAAGLAAAAGLTRFLSTLLYGVSPWDPVVYVLATIVLGLTATLAVFLPARRAARLDPAETLRQE